MDEDTRPTDPVAPQEERRREDRLTEEPPLRRVSEPVRDPAPARERGESRSLFEQDQPQPPAPRRPAPEPPPDPAGERGGRPPHDAQRWSPPPSQGVTQNRVPDDAPTVAWTPPARSPAPPSPPRAAVTPPRAPAQQAEAKGSVSVRRLRRGRLAIRKIDPWAVFKLSLVFYFCMLLVVLLAVGVIFVALKAFGVIDNVEQLLRDLDFYVTISGGVIFRWVFLVGLIGTVLASLITMFMAFLYNLIADVVGGIELLVTERE